MKRLLLFAPIASLLIGGTAYACIYEIRDVCPNIPGIQASPPEGNVIDGNGNCLPPTIGSPPDVCPNIDGYQLVAPDDKKVVDGQCIDNQPPPDSPPVTPAVVQAETTTTPVKMPIANVGK